MQSNWGLGRSDRGGYLAHFFASFYRDNWPVIVAGVVLACAGPLLIRLRGPFGLLFGAAALWLCVAMANWLRLRHFLAVNPRWSRPMSDAWYDSAWDAVWLTLVVVVLYRLSRRGLGIGVSTAGALAVALLAPPVVSVAILFVGCFLGGCP